MPNDIFCVSVVLVAYSFRVERVFWLYDYSQGIINHHLWTTAMLDNWESPMNRNSSEFLRLDYSSQ